MLNQENRQKNQSADPRYLACLYTRHPFKPSTFRHLDTTCYADVWFLQNKSLNTLLKWLVWDRCTSGWLLASVLAVFVRIYHINVLQHHSRTRVNDKEQQDDCVDVLCRGFLILHRYNPPNLSVKETFSSGFSATNTKSSGRYSSQQSWPDATPQLHMAQAHVNDFFVVHYSNAAHEEPSFIRLHASRHKCQGLVKSSKGTWSQRGLLSFL